MDKFNVKSILLGIGMGIIITSVASMIYLAGQDPLSRLSREDIIAQAEKYGMVMKPDAAGETTGIFKVDPGETSGE